MAFCSMYCCCGVLCVSVLIYVPLVISPFYKDAIFVEIKVIQCNLSC